MYEYKVVKYKYSSEMEVGINELAKDGWRVVSTAFWHNWFVSMVVTFEREKKE